MFTDCFVNFPSTALSVRIWQDSIADLLVEARLADWKEDANSQVKSGVIHSGKNLTWYSFRYTCLTMCYLLAFLSQQLQVTQIRV